MRHRLLRWCGVVVLCLTLIVIVASSPKAGPTSQPTSRPKTPLRLTMKRVLTLETGLRRFDPSGIAYDPGSKRLMVVNDKWMGLQLMWFVAPLTGGHQVVRVTPTVLGKATIKSVQSRHWKHLRLKLDLEGAARCGGHWVVISEQLRRVYRIHPKSGVTTEHSIAWRAYQRKTALKGRPVVRFSIAPNAGFEGIACDVKGRRLYVAQERQPRMILVAKMPKVWRDQAPLELVEHFDLPTHLPRRVGRYTLSPDYAGLHFSKGFLYILARNARLLLKVDPKRATIVARRSFAAVDRGLYQSRKPFGLAEGIVMDQKRIWIVYDNNGRPRKVPATSRPVSTTPDRRPLVVEFVRPANF